MRATGAKKQFYLRFNLKSQVKKRGKTKGKDSRKGGPLPAAMQAELDALQALPLPPPVDAAALQSLYPPVSGQYVQAVPPPSFALFVTNRTSLHHNTESRCLVTNFSSLVGDDKLDLQNAFKLKEKRENDVFS